MIEFLGDAEHFNLRRVSGPGQVYLPEPLLIHVLEEDDHGWVQQHACD